MPEQRTPPERGHALDGSVLGRVTSFIVEGFAVCGASLYPQAAWQAAQHEPAIQARLSSQPGSSSSSGQRASPAWDLVHALGTHLRRTRAIRHDTALLEAFDDRMLRDIGIERDQIRHALRLGR